MCESEWKQTEKESEGETGKTLAEKSIKVTDLNIVADDLYLRLIIAFLDLAHLLLFFKFEYTIHVQVIAKKIVFFLYFTVKNKFFCILKYLYYLEFISILCT